MRVDYVVCGAKTTLTGREEIMKNENIQGRCLKEASDIREVEELEENLKSSFRVMRKLDEVMEAACAALPDRSKKKSR